MLLAQFKHRLAMRRRRPGYHSRFGGLWTDRLDADEVLARKLATGSLGDELAGQVRAWMRDGYVVLPGAVPGERIDAINAEIERVWADLDPRYRVETGVGGESHALAPHLRARSAKLLDLYVHCEAAREAAFAPPVEAFLRALFERDLLLFQGLSFERGSGQALHQDTAYVVLDSPMELVACWIALEDIAPGSGELRYYRGSHRLGEHLFRGGFRNWSRKRDGDAAHESYLRGLHQRSREMGLELETFRPKKGDVLVWSADLVHGGGPILDATLTRKSFVTHYCPADVHPFYFAWSRGHDRVREHRAGCGYSSLYYDLGAPQPDGYTPRPGARSSVG